LSLVVISTITFLGSFLGLVVFEFVWHWWQGDAVWQVWEWVNEASLLLFVVEEGAAVTKLAVASLEEVLARHGLVVGVHSSQGGFTKVVWQWVVGLSQLGWAVSELAVLLEWAGSVLEEMLAHLSLELLLHGVPGSLVTVETVVVGLLGEVSHHLTWGVVEVLLGLAVITELSSVLSKAGLDTADDKLGWSSIWSLCSVLWRSFIRQWASVGVWCHKV